MKTNDEALRIRAERLRNLIEMPAYKETVGKWLKEALDDGLHSLKTAQGDEFLRAQGAYIAIESVLNRFEAVFNSARAAKKKAEKTDQSDNGALWTQRPQ